MIFVRRRQVTPLKHIEEVTSKCVSRSLYRAATTICFSADYVLYTLVHSVKVPATTSLVLDWPASVFSILKALAIVF